MEEATNLHAEVYVDRLGYADIGYVTPKIHACSVDVLGTIILVQTNPLVHRRNASSRRVRLSRGVFIK